MTHFEVRIFLKTKLVLFGLIGAVNTNAVYLRYLQPCLHHIDRVRAN